jgi:iron(III) transport system permease protein
MVSTPPLADIHRSPAARRRAVRVAPLWMRAHALVLAALFLLPGVFVVYRAIDLGTGIGDTAGEATGPLGRTVLLATTVSAAAIVVGTTLAWLLVRTALPGRRWLRVAVVLPLVLPSFVGAAALLAAVAPGGVLHGLLGSVGVESPRLRGFWPSWGVLTLFTYPYVFLPVAARLLSLPPSLEESARLLGRTMPQAFFAVTVPQLRGAIVSGGLLVYLYTVSEFGAIQLLGYDTLTRVIFATRLTDRATSFTAALMLMGVAGTVVVAGRLGRGRRGSDDTVRSHPINPLELGRWKVPALGFVAAAVVLGLVVPVASLATWAVRGLRDGRVGFDGLVGPAVNTTLVGVITSVIAVGVVVPLAVLVVRHRSRFAAASSVAVVTGFAVPGLVIALSLVFWSLNAPVVDRLYQTLPLLVAAYVIHFGSQALGAAEDAVRAVPDPYRESSRLLESSAVVRTLRVDLPLMRPSLVAGGGLVLLSTVKELPATLLLAPIGFRTLATEVWGSYEDGFFAEVGITSLALLALSAFLTWVLVLRRSEVVRAFEPDDAVVPSVDLSGPPTVPATRVR